MPTYDTGLMDAYWGASDSRVCASKKCSKPMVRGSKVFIDTVNQVYYCEQCGMCLRFHRKKAHERGENPPKTFEDVDDRVR